MTLGNEVRATGRGKGTAASVLSVSFLTASGLLLRILSLNSRGLWLDEAITVGQATRSWADVIRTLAGGVHPPLYHLIMHFWISQFGRGEIAIRSFALLVGVVAIPAAFWAGARIYDRRTGIIAAGLVAWSPFQIWYSQEARMYELLFLTGLLSIAFLVLAIRENRVHLWVGYFLWTLMGLFTHYFFLFLMVGEVGYYLLGELVPQERQLKAMGTAKAALRRPWSLFSDVRTFGPWLSCSLLMAVLLLMWAFNSVLVSASDGPNALLSSVSGSGLGYGQEGARLAFRFNDVAAVVVQMTAGFHSPAAMESLGSMWPATVYLFLLTMSFTGSTTSRTRALTAGAAGMLAMVLLGQWQGQILASRYFMAVAGPIVLLASRFLAKVDRRMAKPLLAGLVVIALLCWWDQSFNPRNAMRYDNRLALNTLAETWRPGDVILFAPYYIDPLIDYYLPPSMPSYGMPQYGNFGRLRTDVRQMEQDLNRIVGPSSRVWLVLSFQNVPRIRTDGYSVRYWLKHRGYKVRLHKIMSQVELLRFEGQGRPQKFFAPDVGASAVATTSVAAPSSHNTTGAPSMGLTP